MDVTQGHVSEFHSLLDKMSFDSDVLASLKERAILYCLDGSLIIAQDIAVVAKTEFSKKVL